MVSEHTDNASTKFQLDSIKTAARKNCGEGNFHIESREHQQYDLDNLLGDFHGISSLMAATNPNLPHDPVGIYAYFTVCHTATFRG
jgi:hypothetical protein